ncbi:MAG: hypothetical protein ACYDA9_10150 [Terriglobia bacterium]
MLVIIAVLAYYSMGFDAGGTRTLMHELAGSAIYSPLLLISVAASVLSPSGYYAPENPVGSLRMIYTSEGTYSITYTGGYSPTLASLGPGPGKGPTTALAAGLIDEGLASGKKRDYTFTYLPGPRDAKGKIQSYTVSVRVGGECQGFGRSYFMDQTGVIRVTNEDRPATINDPPLAG